MPTASDQIPEFSDEQWCVLDLLMLARQRGVGCLNRHELLGNLRLSQTARARLVFAALLIPEQYIEWQTKHDFSITDAGIELYNRRFADVHGNLPSPTTIGAFAIALPDPYSDKTLLQ